MSSLYYHGVWRQKLSPTKEKGKFEKAPSGAGGTGAKSNTAREFGRACLAGGMARNGAAGPRDYHVREASTTSTRIRLTSLRIRCPHCFPHAIAKVRDIAPSMLHR